MVLDEADRMLDEGFGKDVEKLIGLIPDKNKVKSYLFSATLPDDIQQLAKVTMDDGYSFVTVGIVGGMVETTEQMLVQVRTNSSSV